MFSKIRFSVVSLVLASVTAGCSISAGAPSTSDPPVVPEEAVPRAWSAEESNARRAAIAKAYESDPVAYWATYGLPALARNADIRERGGAADPNRGFATVMTAFDPARFLEACGLGQVHPVLCDLAHGPEGDVSKGLPGAIRQWVANGDADRFSPAGPGPTSELTTQGLLELVATSFLREKVVAFAPAREKTADVLPPVPEEVVCAPAKGGGADAGGLTWENVSTSTTLAGGKPDGMCVTKAVGLCTQRLGLRDADVSPEEWQDLSKELGALPEGGAHIENMKTYFEGKGYAFSEAWDGPFESACAEAFLAYARGCDVFLWYDSGEKTTHIEMVEDIDMTADKPSECVATTNSWGRRATVNVASGTYSNKSDVGNYDDFRPSAAATFYYACKKEK